MTPSETYIHTYANAPVLFTDVEARFKPVDHPGRAQRTSRVSLAVTISQNAETIALTALLKTV
jgi:hypothetical protein